MGFATLPGGPSLLFPPPWGNYLVKGLHEPDFPDAISWAPQTLGWKIIILVLVVALLMRSWHCYCRYRNNQYRRVALKHLAILDVPSGEQDASIPELLKWTAMHGFERATVAGLYGNVWESWLDEQSDAANFLERCPNLLARVAYSPEDQLSENERSALIREVRVWIKTHRGRYD